MLSDRLYQIGLTLIEGVGDIHAKALLAYCGSAEQVFKEKKAVLQKIPGIGEVVARSIFHSKHSLKRAEKELEFIHKYKIQAMFFTDDAYPYRLKYCHDAPVMLYYKGNADLNAERMVAVVGTRAPSDYGKQKVQELIVELSGSPTVIISGLAYGVDGLAHRAALDEGLPTVGVLAHGLDRIYPPAHDNMAKKMIQNGGLLTDFMSETNPDAVNFPKRNRIVAGLCDALVVIESKRTGGSLITATIANSYNKDVFAYPGRAGDQMAEGCNGLIKRNKAGLIESGEDLLYAMQWLPKEAKKRTSVQLPLLLNLSAPEKQILALFEGRNHVHIDEICHSLAMPVSKVSSLLLTMEFANLIKSLPGKMFAAL